MPAEQRNTRPGTAALFRGGWKPRVHFGALLMIARGLIAWGAFAFLALALLKSGVEKAIYLVGAWTLLAFIAVHRAIEGRKP